MPKHLLLVEPDPGHVGLHGLPDRLPSLVRVTARREFQQASRLLTTEPPDLLVTNVRLGAYNGVHLALLADPALTRVIVYTDEHDAGLARDAQAAGAFYERLPRLAAALPSYVQARLPERDLRDPNVVDRRRLFRRGRRAADVPAVFEMLTGWQSAGGNPLA